MQPSKQRHSPAFTQGIEWERDGCILECNPYQDRWDVERRREWERGFKFARARQPGAGCLLDGKPTVYSESLAEWLIREDMERPFGRGAYFSPPRSDEFMANLVGGLESPSHPRPYLRIGRWDSLIPVFAAREGDGHAKG